MYIHNQVLYNMLTKTLRTNKKKCVFGSARFSCFMYSRRLWKFRRVVTRKRNNEHATHALAYAQLLPHPAPNTKYRLSTSVISIVRLLQYILYAFIFRRHWMRYPLHAAWFSSWFFLSFSAIKLPIFKSNLAIKITFLQNRHYCILTIYIFIKQGKTV